MVTFANPTPSAKKKANFKEVQSLFVAMMPAIVRHLRFAFRKLQPEQRQEHIAEALAYTWQAFARLAELGKVELAYASALARFGVARIRVGRRVAGRWTRNDVLSPHARHRGGYQIERLDRIDSEETTWQEAVVEDRTAGPAEIAATRIDFAEWLGTLSSRNRRIALLLAQGEQTGEVADKEGVSPGRISQIRRELQVSWAEFQGERDQAAA